MAVQLRVEDRLQGAQNFPTWKERITRILDVSDAEEHIDSTKVAPTNPADLAAWKKIDSRAMLIIMDGVKDHIVPHLSGTKTAAEMWTTLEILYQSKNENRKMVLQERMHSIKMAKGERVVPYLTRLTQIRDDLGEVGSKNEDEEVVRIALSGFSKPWDTFFKGVVAREKQLIGRDYGMNLCRRRPAWVKDQAHPAVPHKLWMRRLLPWQGRERVIQR